MTMQSEIKVQRFPVLALANQMNQGKENSHNVRGILGGINGVQQTSITTRTVVDLYAKVENPDDPTAKKVNNPHRGKVVKYAKQSVTIGVLNYENRVNRELGKEGLEQEFEASPMIQKYDRIFGTSVLQLIAKPKKEGEFGEVNHYLCYIVNTNNKNTKTEVEYFIVNEDGSETAIAKEDIIGMKPEKAKTDNYQGGLHKDTNGANEVVYRVVKLQNIVKIGKFEGSFYFA